ncbi:DNA-directed RNA polymerase subunit L [Candidatus Bathyarchaeota archaeon]|nr:DNA-directed RNA polymerase subunit L [Candidatus Bathyarchaeota archaeon]
MKVKTLKKTERELRVEIDGEGHTFCNLLQNVLLEDSAVEIAGYDVPHPLATTAVMYIRMKRSDPAKALERALKKISERSDEFLERFQKAIGNLQ